jgi:hypothetical protein
MRNGIFPVFTKGRVLKKESVEYLRDFPYDLASLAFEGYSDGIIFGFSVTFKNGCILVSKGALKYQEDIIIVPGSDIAIPEYGVFLYVKLIVGGLSETEDYKIRHMGISIDSRKPSGENEMELGRFCLNAGAVLRCKYDSFSDLRTLENTLDITRVSFAGVDAPTLHPVVLKEFARALMLGSSDTTDTAFALMCINASVVQKECIQWYLAKKNNCAYEEYSLSELYDKLAETLPKTSVKSKAERPRRKGRPSIS